MRSMPPRNSTFFIIGLKFNQITIMKANRYVIAASAIALAASFSSCSDEHIHLERSTTIDASKDFVYEHVSTFAGMNEWSPWTEKDPEMTSSIEGEDGAIGTVYKWSGNDDVGVGSQTITELGDGMIKTHMVFEGMGEADATIQLTEADGKTTATWHYDQDVTFPGTIFMMFVDMEEMLGPDYQKGMDKLKELVESNKTAKTEFDGYTIATTDMEERTYVGVRDTVAFSEMQPFFAAGFAAATGGCEKSELEMNGMPCGIYFVWDEANQTTECMAAIPVAPGSSADGLEAFTTGGKALMLDHFGAYEKLGDAHMAMEAYMKWHGTMMNGPAIEEYMNDPTTVADASEIHTRIYYPIQ